MESSSAIPDSSAESVFAGFLEQIEAGDCADFDALCRAHPALAPRLRRLHARWQAVTEAFTALSQADEQARPAADPAALSALLARLGQDGGRRRRYALGAELARGAMGRIVKAWDEELRRDVALKIHRQNGDDARLRRRFVEEAQIAAQLDHPGIVPVHELGLDAEGRPFFAMRLVHGRDLGEVLALAHDGAEGWTRTRVLGVLLRVCEAMAYAHDKGVVHRDLKPGNVMVGRFGETYVMDWGLARVRGASDAPESEHGVDTLRGQIAAEDERSPLLTRHGDVVGTPAYMAPEQASGGEGMADPAVDTYALGAMLYHLLAGHMPYAPPGEPIDASQIVDAVRAGPPPPLPSDVPPELRAICERAMARDPAQRYAGVEALAEDLRAFLELRVVRAHAQGGLAELRKWVARNRALSICLLLLVVALAAGGLTTTSFWLAAEGARQRADANADRLATELERTEFRSARQALQLDDSRVAAEMLWRQHFTGHLPRATRWALIEHAARDPVLNVAPVHRQGDVAFARAVDHVLLAGGDSQLLRFAAADLAPLPPLGEPGGAELTALAVPAAAPWAVTGDADGAIAFWDLEGGQQTRALRAHSRSIADIALAPQGSALASGDQAGLVRLWRGPSAEPADFCTMPTSVRSLEFTPAGDLLAIGDARGGVRVLAIDGAVRLRYRFGDQPILALSFAADGSELWIGSGDQIQIIDVASGQRLRTLPTRNGTCRDLLHEASGDVIVGGWFRIDHLAANGDQLRPLALRGVWRLDADPTTRRAVAVSRAHGLHLIDTGARDRRDFPGSRTVALSADGRAVLVRIDDAVVAYDVESARPLGRITNNRSGWLSTDAVGRRLATTSGAVVRVHDLTSGELLYELAGPEEAPFHESCVFSPDGSEFALVVGRDRVERRAASDGALLAAWSYPGRRLLRLTYSPDGAVLAIVPRASTTVHLVTLRDGAQRDVTFDTTDAHGVGSSICAAALDRDGQQLAVGTWPGQILVRDLRTQSTRTFVAHAGTTWSLLFATDDPDLLLTSGGANGVTFWDLATGECCLQMLRDEAPVGQLQLSRDGRTLACQTLRGVVVIDLTYRERHVAGCLPVYASTLRASGALAPEREAELQRWADAVLARPWPRWR